MISGRDIICISSIDWDFIWQGHQQIMSTLAANGNRVLFIENTGVRAPKVSDFGRVTARLRNWWRGTKGFRQEREGLYVYSPLVLPWPYSRVSRAINVALMMRALRRWMQATDFHRPIVWTFLPTPLARGLIRALDPGLVVYYCIDDLASSSPQARRIAHSEVDIFRRADLVFVTSEKLRARAAQYNERVHLFPFGVDYREFERVRLGPDPAPGDLQQLRRPVVGYLGGLHQWVDQDLVAAVARALPDMSFAMVGPAQDDVSTLAACPNIHLLGPKSHADVPKYLKHFDVGLVPYRISEYTANVYPTKLNEYLAMGTPVVATDLPEIRRFNREYGNIVSTASDPQGFAAAVRHALADGSEAARNRRIEAARSNGWDARIDAMSALIDERLAAGGGQGAGWEKTLRGLYLAARTRVAVMVATAAIVVFLLFYTPLIWWAASPLHLAVAPVPADAIVVFAGGVGESGQAGGGYQERVRKAIDLYQGGYAEHLVFSSGFSWAFKEAEVMKALAVEEGVPAGAILLETRAANTHENVVNVAAILNAHGWRRILLVSSPYHMRRAVLAWRRAAPDVAVSPTPTEYSQFYLHASNASLAQIEGIVHEYAALAAYWWRGWA